jgi:hypothetical protein
MALINDVHSVIVAADSPNLSAHSYTEIYGGDTGCTIVVNGTSVAIGAASSITITVRTVSGGSGCYLLGVNKDVYLGSTNLP